MDKYHDLKPGDKLVITNGVRKGIGDIITFIRYSGKGSSIAAWYTKEGDKEERFLPIRCLEKES